MVRSSLTIACAVLLCSLAHADSDPNEALARAYFRTGQLAFEAGRFTEAVDQFEHAVALAPRPALLYNLGKAKDAAHDAVGARAVYARLIEGHALPEEELALLRARATALEGEIGRLDVQGGVRDADVRIDGRMVGKTPLTTLEINAGTHAIEVEHPRVGRVHGTLRIDGGQRASFDASGLIARRGTPTYKKWWLWTIVGVVVAGGAVTAGILGARAVDRASVPSSALPEATR